LDRASFGPRIGRGARAFKISRQPDCVRFGVGVLSSITSPATSARHRRGRNVKCLRFRLFPLFIGSIVKRLTNAIQNSLRGLADGFKTEPALRDEAILFVAAVPLGLLVAPSAAWYVAMIGALIVVLAVEFLNTAIEKLADHVTPEQNTDIRRIKDFGSAAVFCSLCLAGLIWFTALVARCGLI
jgi:diacylglycerol kinase (ATP)